MTQEKLLNELYILLCDKHRKDSCIVSINTDPREVVKEVQKLVSKSSESDQIELLLKAIEYVKFKISKNICNAGEILNSLPTFVRDEKRRLKEAKTMAQEKLKVKEIKRTENKKLKSEEKIQKEKDRQMFLKIIANWYKELEDRPRKELLNLNECYKEKMFADLQMYNQKASKGNLEGDINLGLFGYTKTNYLKNIREQGVRISKKDEDFSIHMDEDLLKLKLIGYCMVSKFCSKANKRKETFKKDYEYLRIKTKEFAEILRDVYYEINDIYPIEQLTDSIIGPQMHMEIVYDGLDGILEKGKTKQRK